MRIVECDGKVVAEGKGMLFDECGVAFHSGAPRFAPRTDLWNKYLASLPAPEKVSGLDRSDAEPKADPDPTPNTHQAGSPRNRYYAVEAAK